jgi:hypothetical protein
MGDLQDRRRSRRCAGSPIDRTGSSALEVKGRPGHRTYNEEQRSHGEPTVGFGEYLAHFGEATFEN